jgi:plasmid stabilization system protein ParE
MKVEFTPLAERQIEDLYNYIADHSSERIAEDYAARIGLFVHEAAGLPAPWNEA